VAAVDDVAEKSAVAAEAEEGIPVEFEVVAAGTPASVVVEAMGVVGVETVGVVETMGVVIVETMYVVVVWKVPAEAAEFGPGVPWLVVFCASLGKAFAPHVL